MTGYNYEGAVNFIKLNQFLTGNELTGQYFVKLYD